MCRSPNSPSGLNIKPSHHLDLIPFSDFHWVTAIHLKKLAKKGPNIGIFLNVEGSTSNIYHHWNHHRQPDSMPSPRPDQQRRLRRAHFTPRVEPSRSRWDLSETAKGSQFPCCHFCSQIYSRPVERTKSNTLQFFVQHVPSKDSEEQLKILRNN